MLLLRSSIATTVLTVALGAGALPSCGGDDKNVQAPANGADGGVGDAGEPDAFYPVAEASDPCEVAGYFFDGESDCDEVRCPELTCECPSDEEVDVGDDPPPAETIVLSACAQGGGCLSLVDCTRLCEPAAVLFRQACEERLAASGSLACGSDDDCVVGECREESVGSICIDTMRCVEDGHCGAGSACRFDPDLLDPDTSLPTSLGTCADGLGGSLCFDDNDCKFGSCIGDRCSGGDDGDTCQLNDNCASGHCLVYDSSGDGTGSCVSGDRGASCVDDGDCDDGLHCTGSTCVSDEVGQACESDDQCASGVCVSGHCRAGQLTSWCEEDADCSVGFCVSYRCASGDLLSPCLDSGDCNGTLTCSRQVCSDGTHGMPCSTAEDCTVHACVRSTCRDGANGSVCESPSDCASGYCANPAGVEPGECTSGAAGAICIVGTQCASGSCVAGVCD